MDYPRRELIDHVAKRENVCLGLGRQGIAVQDPMWSLISVSRHPADANVFRRGGINIFPLYLYPQSEELGLHHSRRANFSENFLAALAAKLELAISRNEQLPSGLTPEDIFNYIYAVFHSPGYRIRYAEFLKIDFPRLPLTGNLELFRALAKLGAELVALHLLESPKLDKPITEYIGKGREVAKVGYTDNTVWIDAGGTKLQTAAGTSGFKGVPEDVWNFHIGGYQVCEKWLKDRKGRTLSKDDIAHYHKVVVALSGTIRLMAEIDKVIDQHGGWPGAFASTNIDATTQEEPPKARNPSKPAPSDELPLEVEGELALARPTTNQDEKLEFDEIESMSLVRDWFEKNGSSDREEAAKGLIYSLGYDRAGPRLMEQADNLIRTAVRRGILRNEGGELSLLARSIADYEREFLKTQFLAAIGQTWISRDEAMRTFARWLGFSRTGPAIQDTARSLINGLLRETRLEAGAPDSIRRT